MASIVAWALLVGGLLAATQIQCSDMKICKKSQASLALNTVERAAKQHFERHGRFPRGTASMPPWACCGKDCGSVPGNAWESDPVWSALGVSWTEPLQFRYSYASDGSTVWATATGDRDCDGTSVTYSLRVVVEAGKPQSRTFEPEVRD